MTNGRSQNLLINATIILIALVVRFLIAIPCLTSLRQVSHYNSNYASESICYTDDSPRYERLALNLLKHHIFQANTTPPFSGELPGGNPPELYRTPAYPAFLAMIYGFAGYQSGWAIVVQIFLSVATCLLVYQIGRETGGYKAGFAAALLYAIYPRAALHAAQIMSETLFIFFLTASILSLLHFFRQPQLYRAILAGALLAGAAYTRQVGLYLPVIFLPVWVVFIFRFPQPRQAIGGLTTLLVVFSSLTGLWYYRNYRIYDRWYYSTLNDFNAAFFLSPWVVAQQLNSTNEEAQLYLLQEICNKHAELRPYCTALEADSEVYWRWVEDIQINSKAGPIARQTLMRQWRYTIPSFAGGAFWSLWAGSGEWRGILLAPSDYTTLKTVTIEAKKALYSGNLTTTFRLISDEIFPQLPWGFLIVFGGVWLLSAAMYLLAIPGFLRLQKTDLPMALVLGLTILFLAMVAGPAANNRQFAPAYPVLSCLAALSIYHTKITK